MSTHLPPVVGSQDIKDELERLAARACADPVDLRARALRFLQSRFPGAVVHSDAQGFFDPQSRTIIKLIHRMIALDPRAAVRQRLIAVPDLSRVEEVFAVAKNFQEWCPVAAPIEVRYGHAANRSQSVLSSLRMAESPKIIIYSDRSSLADGQIVQILESFGVLVEFVRESDMYSSVFMSYGSPDERFAGELNSFLKAQGVQTWFFPLDSLPGQKLHRMMATGVEVHDRVLLICSHSSLGRAGVLNEIERVLEREAREGGADILIPIAIDDYVFTNWAPQRPDIATQVRSRVIVRFPANDPAGADFLMAASRLVLALKK